MRASQPLRLLLTLCALMRPQGCDIWQGAAGELQFLQELDGPVCDTQATTAHARLRHHARMHAAIHVITVRLLIHASQVPVLWMPMAAQIGRNAIRLDDYALQPVASGRGRRCSGLIEAWGGLCGFVGELRAT